MKYYSPYFGQAYGEGTYGCGTYQHTEADGTCTTTAAGGGTGTSGNGSDGLTNTGIGIAVFVTLACLIIFVSLVVRIWRRPKLVPQEIENPERQQDTEFRS